MMFVRQHGGNSSSAVVNGQAAVVVLRLCYVFRRHINPIQLQEESDGEGKYSITAACQTNCVHFVMLKARHFSCGFTLLCFEWHFLHQNSRSRCALYSYQQTALLTCYVMSYFIQMLTFVCL